MRTTGNEELSWGFGFLRERLSARHRSIGNRFFESSPPARAQFPVANSAILRPAT
jgi:hypothetical protein